jgi:hypothetical protein
MAPHIVIFRYNPVMVAATTESSILSRVIQADAGNLPHDLARYVLTLDFPPADHQRIAELSAKAQAGALTDEEQAELDAYLRVNNFLMIVRSKARMSLKQPPDRRIAG